VSKIHSQVPTYQYQAHQNVMIDIETTGTDPREHEIMEIGAVVFDDHFRLGPQFQCHLPRIPERKPSKATIQWWIHTDKSLFDSHREKQKATEKTADEIFFKEKAAGVLKPERLHMLIRRRLEMLLDFLPKYCTVWAWPPSFDIEFLKSYASLVDLDLGPVFWVPIDGRSYIRGNLAGTGLDYWEVLREAQQEVRVKDGLAHTSIHDCLHQIGMIAHCAGKASSRLLDLHRGMTSED